VVEREAERGARQLNVALCTVTDSVRLVEYKKQATTVLERETEVAKKLLKKGDKKRYCFVAFVSSLPPIISAL
jgi:hypothetical protein